MANYKVAYGKRDNIEYAIEREIIPPGCIIMTEDSNEIFFYDLNRRLKSYEEKYRFESRTEVQEWLKKNDCSGQIFSVHEEDRCNLYVVNYNNELEPISANNANYISSDRHPTAEDKDYKLLTYWINETNEEVYLLVSIVDGRAVWKSLTSSSDNPTVLSGDLSYIHSQSRASNEWVVTHNLNKYPAVSIVDSAGNVVVGDVSYIDTNSIILKFNGAFSGKAYLN